VVGFCDPLESYHDLKDLFQPAPAALSDPLPLSRYATQFMFRDLSSGFEFFPAYFLSPSSANSQQIVRVLLLDAAGCASHRWLSC